MNLKICPKCKNPATESSDYTAAVYYKGSATFKCGACSYIGPPLSISKEDFLLLKTKK